MEYQSEKVIYDNPLLSLRIFEAERDDDFFINWHYHPQLELLLVKNGALEVHIDEQEAVKVDAGEVCIIGANQLHRDRSSSFPCHYIVLQFELEPFLDPTTMPYVRYFSESKSPLSDTNYIFKENAEVRLATGRLIESLLHEVTDKQRGYELAVSMHIKHLLLMMLRADSRNALVQSEDFDRARLHSVLDYVENHLDDRIQVEEVSKLANMSYYYFVKFFKRAIGMSFTEYVNYRKIKWAERILLTKDLSISEVGDQIGMPNMAHFYKMFKKYNDCSPKQYQKRMMAWSVE